MNIKDLLEYAERFLNRIANPVAILAFIMAAMTFTIYHPLNQAIAANGEADKGLSNNFYMTQMYDILKQAEKMNGDTVDIKKADMFKLVSICEDEAFNVYLKEVAPTRMKLETEHMCGIIKKTSMQDSVID